MALKFLNDGYFAGKVGIGIQSPAAKLHVNPTTANEIAIAINGTQNYSAGQFQRIAAGDSNSINRLSIGFGYDNPTDWSIRYSSYGRHEFYTGNDWGNAANTEKMVITSSGNVGIGTGSPDNLLHVQGSNNPRIDLGEDTNNKGWMRWNNADNYIDFTTRVGGTYYADTLVLRNGNVGIGTTSPITKFQITATNASSPTANIFLDIDGSNVPGMGGQIIFGASTSANLAAYIARIQGVRSALDNGSSDLHFQTTHVATGTGPSTKMTILSDGKVGIGTTTPGEKLEVNGRIKVQTSSGSLTLKELGSGSATIAGSGTVGIEAVSNFRVKTNSSNEAFTVLSTGNVGIGKTNPGQKLDVSGSIASNSIYLYDSTSNDRLVLDLDASDNLQIATGTSTGSRGITFFTENSEKMRILSGGNVGIGTTGPGSKLEVAAANSQIRLTRY